MTFGLGLFFDLRNPPQWERPWSGHYRHQLDLMVEAERLGASSVWLTEHHRFEDGYLPQPLVLAAAVAERTSTVRIGTAIMLAPIRHPVHIAEEAVVDLLSDGRLELGLGAGYAPHEFAMFGANEAKRFSSMFEVASQVRRLLDEGGVTPGPLQRPLPLWMGSQGPKGARRAGRIGTRLLSLAPPVVASYLKGLDEGGHDRSIAQVAGDVDVIVADDPEAAWERVLPHHLHQLNTYRRAHGGQDLTREDMGDRLANGRTTAAVRLVVLTVDEAVAHLRNRSAGLPVAHMYTWATVAGMPDDLVERHIELYLGPVRAHLGVGAGSGR